MRKRVWIAIVLLLLLLGGAWWEHSTRRSAASGHAFRLPESPLRQPTLEKPWRPPAPPSLAAHAKASGTQTPLPSDPPPPGQEETTLGLKAMGPETPASTTPIGALRPWRVVHGEKVIAAGDEGKDAARRYQLAVAKAMESTGGAMVFEMDFETTSSIPTVLVAPPDADITPRVIEE